VQDFSRISEKNVGSQPNFSRIFTYRDNSAKPNISRNFFPASRNLKKIRLGGLIKMYDKNMKTRT